ncbi:hypothetical protein [Desulfoscipio gibsoniae]|uniref:Uncharacterized protein n=1 Tax=Desulfoscipio gibsoniae DSM 7213 TaxID=767817 RepID=R4KEX7_9FIRM|nr:hypothetical protein [Desulfoscipio gibsoniae]AGL01139.1 hypothetical protein Desgi_1668 [Desulfoscipio gibsoniae DSM 7213]
MLVDYEKLNINLKGALVHGVISLKYVVGGRTFADIDILDFGNGFGSQATIRSNETEYGSVSSGKYFNSIEDAVNDVIILIEKEIIVDEYVRNCQE